MATVDGIKPIVKKEISEMAERCNIQQVILFGSRARGDYRERSDIDLAVTGGDTVLFSLLVEEETSTLLKFDVVNLDGAVQSELRDSIQNEGIVIYEKI
ncbi:MAG: nucleotidyltransferase domain-containing protein [Eubacteriales bacterium]|nr:nucleotidyltransferase domain-containing protein [Eubacteriales bacterium]